MGFTSFYQWFSGKLSTTAASIDALTKILTCHCWTPEAYLAFTEHKWSLPLAMRVISWCHIAVDFHFWSSSVSREKVAMAVIVDSFSKTRNFVVKLVFSWCSSPNYSEWGFTGCHLFIGPQFISHFWAFFSRRPAFFPLGLLLSVKWAEGEGLIRRNHAALPGCIQSIHLEIPALVGSMHLQIPCRSCSQGSLHLNVRWVTCQSRT